MSELNRRKILQGLFASAVTTVMPTMANAQRSARDYDVLIISDSNHSAGKIDGLSDPAFLRNLSAQGIKVIGLELPADLKGPAHRGPEAVRRHVEQAFKQFGYKNADVIEGTKSKYVWLSLTANEIEQNARRYGMRVEYVDPMSTADLFRATTGFFNRLVIGTTRTALDPQMARNIKEAGTPSAVFIGSAHARNVSNILSSEYNLSSRIISSSSLVAEMEREISIHKASLTPGLGAGPS